MNEELASLYVRIKADAEPYTKTIKSLVRSVRGDGKAMGGNFSQSATNATNQGMGAWVRAVKSRLREVGGAATQRGRELADQFTGSFLTWTKRGLAGLGIALGVALAAAIGVATSSIELGADALETESLLDTSLGPAADDLNERLQAFASDANRSFRDLQGGASTFVAMTKAMGFSERGAAGLSASFTEMASDLGSFFNVPTEQALEDLTGALAGSSETLQKYGIDVRETTLKQLALERGIIKNASETIPRQARALLILEAAQMQASDAMGDSIRTADGFQNTLRGLVGWITDVRTKLGVLAVNGLQPAFALMDRFADVRLTPFIDEAVLPQIERVTNAVGVLFTSIAAGNSIDTSIISALATLGVSDDNLLRTQLFIDAVQAFFETGFNTENISGLMDALQIPQSVADSITVLFGWLIDNQSAVVGAFQAIGVAAAALVAAGTIAAVGGAIASLANPVTAIVIAVGLLGAAWRTNFLGIRDIVQEVAAAVQGVFGQLAPILAQVAAAVQKSVGGSLSDTFAVFVVQLDRLRPLLDDVLAIGGLFASVFAAQFAAAVLVAVGAVNGLGNAFTLALPFFVNFVLGFAETVKSGAAFISSFVNLIIALFTGDEASISAALNDLGVKALAFWTNFNQLIIDYAGFITATISGFVLGFVQFFIDLYEQLTGQEGIVGRMANDALATVSDWVADMLQSVDDFVDDTVGKFEDAKTMVVGKIGELAASGKNALQPLVDGINAIVGTIDAVRSAFSSLVSYLRNLNIPNPFAGFSVPSFGFGENWRGTSNWRGGLTFVAERGPERIVLPSGGSFVAEREMLLNLPAHTEIWNAAKTRKDRVALFDQNVRGVGESSINRAVSRGAHSRPVSVSHKSGGVASQLARVVLRGGESINFNGDVHLHTDGDDLRTADGFRAFAGKRFGR